MSSEMNGSTHGSGSEDRHIDEGETPGTKRKDDGSGNHPQQRAKRNRYISIACNECKRRKIKCNGQTPCQRCGNLSLECLYAPNCCSSTFKDSEEFRQMKSQISSLQEQVDTLFANLNSFKQERSSPLDSSSFSHDASRSISISQKGIQTGPSPRSRAKFPRFHGPTSSAFSFDVAKSSLQTMGITQPEAGVDEGVVTGDATPVGSPPAQLPVHPTKDPLWLINREEAIRLCRTYEEEVGMMYPMFEIETVIQKTNMLYTFLEAAHRAGLAQRHLPGPDAVNDDDTNILKMIFATQLIIENAGKSELAKRLFENVRSTVESKLWDPVDTKGLILLCLVAMYYFHQDEEGQAWRIIGITGRLSLEMGLHRRDSLLRAFPNEEEYLWTVKLFWTIYSLDRRWSFGTGMPFSLQDADIDPYLPEPDTSTPYLKAMTQYNHIASKVWYSGLGLNNATDMKKGDMDYLNYQVLNWQKSIPDSLQFHHPDSGPEQEVGSGALRRLRLILYLRANQMRILIYRPVLHSATSIMENRDNAQMVVDVAKDTIRVLTRVNQTSDIYRTQQQLYNYFLVSALAVLFLAVSHAPIEFNRHVRDEFYMALDLVKGFSTKSYLSKRLWKTIRGLREVGEKLGLIMRQAGTDAGDPHSNAAVAMAGLAGHPIEQLGIYPSDMSNSPMNGLQMSHELTNLFEAVGGYGNFMGMQTSSEGMNGFVASEGDMHNAGEGMPAVFGNEDEFARIMGELF